MDTSFHERAGRILLEAFKQPAYERQGYLDRACEGDPELRAEVDSLLSAAERDIRLLDDPDRTSIPESISASQRERLIGRQIGNYTIQRVIASGGMGTVYEATQEKPRRTVALKVMRHGLAAGSALRRFEFEAQILGQLRHPGIAQVYEASVYEDDAGGVPYFVMEYIPDALPVTEYAQRKELGTRERLELLATVCDAVQHGHQNAVIHRDLKPGNILVDGSGQAKVIDFGVARATDADIQLTTVQPDVGQLIGTVPYMSPEQIVGDRAGLDTRSDVYALGVLLYELLSGRLPHEVHELTLPEAARRIREEEPSPLSSFDRLFRGDVETIVAKALEKDKQRRYASAAELAADIRRYLSHEPIVARPASTFYQFRKFARRNRGLVTGAAAGAAALVVGTVFALSYAFEANAQAQRADQRFIDVRDLAGTLILDIHESIQDLPGATAARELLVSTALEYLRSLEREAPDDPGVRRELAAAYLRIGDVQGERDRPSLGRPEEAEVSYRKAHAIATALRRDDPADDWARRIVALSLTKLGGALDQLGRTEEAEACYTESLRLHEANVSIDPDDAVYTRSVAVAQSRLAQVARSTGRREEALTGYRKSLGINRRLAERYPGESLHQEDVAFCLAGIGDMLADAGDREASLAAYQESLQVRQAVHDADPLSASARQNLGRIHVKIGNHYWRDKNLETALPHFRSAHTLFAALSKADPDDADLLWNLAVSQNKLGDTLLGLGRADEALAAYQQALEIREDLVGDRQVTPSARRELASSYSRIGRVYKRMGRLSEALGCLERCDRLAEAAAAESPSDTRSQRSFAVSKYNLSEMYTSLAGTDGLTADERLAHWVSAKGCLTHSRDIFASLAEADALSASDASLPDQLTRKIERVDKKIEGLTGPES